MVIVDDDLLLDILAGTAPTELKTDIYTTGCWYYRLARAIHSSAVSGTLSRSFGQLDAGQQTKVLDALDELPSGVGLVSFRFLVPIMHQLDPSFRLNLLSAEALAAALLLDASIRVTTPNPMLAKAAEVLGVDYALLK